VDILDAETGHFLNRVEGMVGTTMSNNGGTPTTNGPGPNGVLVTNHKILWAGDGNSMTRVADVDPDSPNYPHIIHSIDTSIPACDGGTDTTRYCGRDDEIGFDPRDRIILIANNAPLDVNPPHHSIDPYATFISADPPYAKQGTISFPNVTGLEQPLWDPGLDGGRFLLTVPGSIAHGIAPSIAVIDPISHNVVRMFLNCNALLGTASQSITGIALGRNQHLLVSACGASAIPSAPIILNARTGQPIAVIHQVGGGDEVWYNPGDDRFYVTGTDRTVVGGVQSLGVIDARTSRWLQNVPDVRGKNPSAFPDNNHVFTVVQITQPIADGTQPDDSICAQHGIQRKGCVSIFGPSDDEDGNDQGGNGNDQGNQGGGRGGQGNQGGNQGGPHHH
jgi:hypothetical protein